MSVLSKSEIESTTLSTSLHTGQGAELFISGFAPTTGSAQLRGELTDLFISGS